MNMGILLLIIHFICGIIAIIIHTLTGGMKYAKEYGDGMRIATPSQCIIQLLLFWEIYLLIDIIEIVEYYIDNLNW